jgi:hypothetical protein
MREDLETLFRATGNPLYALRAVRDYELCPDRAPWPEWVVSYLRAVADALTFLADTETPGAAAKQTNAAMGLTGRGFNRFADYRQDIRAFNAAHVQSIRGQLFVRPDGTPEKADVSNEWLGKALGTKTRRTQELAARGRKLKAATAKG